MSQTAPSQSRATEIGRAFVHGTVWFMLAWPLFRGEAALLAAAGGFAGCLVGVRLGRSPLRMSALIAGAALGVLIIFGLRQLAVGSSVLGSVFGPAFALRIGEATFCALLAFTVSALLRAASIRKPIAALFEVILVALGCAQLFVAHRHGAINRPFRFSDPIIALGGDPTVWFLFAGGVATAVALLLLMREKRIGRGLLHFGVVLFLLALIVQTTQMLGLPTPEPSSGLGLRPEEDQGQGADGEQQQRPGGGSQPPGEHQRQGRPDDDLEFRENYDSAGSPVPIAVVIFHDDYSPPNGYYYFRQGAFSQYNGRRLVNTHRDDVDLDLIEGFPTTQAIPVREPPETNANRALLETTVAMMANHTRPFALEAPLEVAPTSNPDPNRFKRVYRATSGVLTADYVSMLGSPAGSQRWTSEQWGHYTGSPADPRYNELGAEILSALPESVREDPIARAFAITDWLGEKGVYSLKNQHAQADDPTSSFLFGDITGYCVHFAHAATYLMRSVGLPARVANGYAIDEASRQGGSALMLSGAYSHAWPEVYLDGYGWVIVDVAPERSLVPPPEPNDADLQRLLGELARGERPTPPIAVDLPELKRKAQRAGSLFVYAVALVGGFLFLLLLSVKLWRRVAPSFASAEELPRVLFRADLDRMSEVALRRMRGESREAFARRLQQRLPSLAPLTDRHLAAAFGNHSVSRDRLRSTSSALRDELRLAVAWWRRWLGIITPWSWLTTR